MLLHSIESRLAHYTTRNEKSHIVTVDSGVISSQPNYLENSPFQLFIPSYVNNHAKFISKNYKKVHNLHWGASRQKKITTDNHTANDKYFSK